MHTVQTLTDNWSKNKPELVNKLIKLWPAKSWELVEKESISYGNEKPFHAVIREFENMAKYMIHEILDSTCSHEVFEKSKDLICIQLNEFKGDYRRK